MPLMRYFPGECGFVIAFARSASLLILDEPTSNLDARAESTLFTRFRALAKGRTTIIVSLPRRPAQTVDGSRFPLASAVR